LALEAAKDASIKAGLNAEIVSSEISGEAREVGLEFARKALKLKKQISDLLPLCLISGGETTVTVKGNGKGGRNMEMALAFAMNIEGVSGITLLSAGTDGNDGPTDATGAIVDGLTVTNAKMKGLDPEKYLENNDSYNFFEQSEGLLITGPTGTNVMDVQIMIIS
jgi:glycerate 2-kinase